MSRTRHGDDRGGIGVGTLVVYAGVVLVAATGAGVALAAATSLDVTAMSFGAETLSEFTGRVDVQSTTGGTTESTVVSTLTVRIQDGESVASDGKTRTLTVDEIDLEGTSLVDSAAAADRGTIAVETDELNATDDPVTATEGNEVNVTVLETDERTVRTVDDVRATVARAPGSDPVDLADATVRYEGRETVRTLERGDEADGDAFATTGVVGDETRLSERGDRIHLEIDAAAVRGTEVLENDDGELRARTDAVGLEADETATITVDVAGGGTTEVRVRAPTTVEDEAVRL
ncbi:hypothetical protein ACFQGT_03375 [Natrialbaceae archaeon GCM10025810]|uniref:hypothetical protein n=1 Tax=Halovalidus salilacus TaxID=3075124 RepID=UPI003618B714